MRVYYAVRADAPPPPLTPSLCLTPVLAVAVRARGVALLRHGQTLGFTCCVYSCVDTLCHRNAHDVSFGIITHSRSDNRPPHPMVTRQGQ